MLFFFIYNFSCNRYLTAKGDNLELQSRSATFASELALARDRANMLKEDLSIEREMRVNAEEARKAAEQELEFRMKVEQVMIYLHINYPISGHLLWYTIFDSRTRAFKKSIRR